MIVSHVVVATLIPGEAFIFGKSLIWALFWTFVALAIRDESKSLLTAITRMLERLVELKLGKMLKITVRPVPPEASPVPEIESELEEKDVTKTFKNSK